VQGPEALEQKGQKNMKTEQVKQVTDKALGQLINALDREFPGSVRDAV
jgi:hypothetical protein